MEIIPIHYLPSAQVISWFAIEHEAEELAKFCDSRDGTLAIHHSQVSNRPMNYFVLNKKILDGFIDDIGSQFIINPKITGYMKGTEMMLSEGCASFPHKKPKNVQRAFVVNVEYEIPDPMMPNGLRKVEKQVERIIAQIFQHECDHANGKNIYFFSKKGV